MSQIPIIDVAPLFRNDHSAKLNVAKQIDEACRSNGFFSIKNHGIDNLDSLEGESFRFFKQLTQEQRLELAPNKWNPTNPNTYRGYFPAKVDGKEGYDICNPTLCSDNDLILNNPLHEILVWPDEALLPGFRKYFEGYYLKMVNLSRTLLAGFALATGKEENFFYDKVDIKDTLSTLRLNYYPFLDNIEAVETGEDGTKLGCAVHRDGVVITILFQPIEGLQVENGEGWINVEPSAETLVVNTGICMSRWTNGGNLNS